MQIYVFILINDKKFRRSYSYTLMILIPSNDPERIQKMKNKLSQKFSIKDLGPASYCLGFEIKRGRESLSLSQTGFIRDVLRRFGMEECKTGSTPIDTTLKAKSINENEQDGNNENYPFLELIGGLMYLGIGTRPDIAHAVNVLSQFNNNYERMHWLAAKRILR